MSVSIKLSRVGATNNVLYRLVAQTTRSKRDGKSLAILGSYDPKKKILNLKQSLLDEWIKKGAILTQGVRKVLEAKKEKSK